MSAEWLSSSKTISAILTRACVIFWILNFFVFLIFSARYYFHDRSFDRTIALFSAGAFFAPFLCAIIAGIVLWIINGDDSNASSS